MWHVYNKVFRWLEGAIGSVKEGDVHDGDHLRCMNLSMNCQLSYFLKFVQMEPPILDEYERHVVGAYDVV